jgi:hypothetical protein
MLNINIYPITTSASVATSGLGTQRQLVVSDGLKSEERNGVGCSQIQSQPHVY